MKSRALNLAALALLVGLSASIGGGVGPAASQQLDAGKPPAQIFSGTCSACHRSPRGLVRSVSPGALPGFLRQHYTTGGDMAGTMAAYVLSNGGTQQVTEPPKREPKQRAKSDAPEVAARPVEPKDQARTAKQKAARKGQDPSAKDTPAAQEPEKPDTAKPDAAPEKSEEAVAKPAEPVAEPSNQDRKPERKPETAAADCKVEEPAKQADENKPRQPAALLTLPGFPAPEPAPEPEPAAGSAGCEPATSTAATPERNETPAAAEQVKDEPKEQARDAAPAASPPTPAEAPKSESLRATVSDSASSLDIMQEEVHAPRPVRPSQQKKRVAPQ